MAMFDFEKQHSVCKQMANTPC